MLTEAYAKLYDEKELSVNEIRQLKWHTYANFERLNYKYFQYQVGMVEESEWSRKVYSIKWQFSSNRMYREAWEEMKFNFDPAFIQVIDSVFTSIH